MKVAKSITKKPFAYEYISEKKTLYVNKGVKFAVQFNIGFPPPSGTTVIAMVRCAETEDVQKFGAVRRCKKHAHLDGGKVL